MFTQKMRQKNGSGEYDSEQNWENMGIQLVKDLLNSSVKEADNTNGASAESESLFWFYLCDSEEQLKAHVASEKAECGYVVQFFRNYPFLPFYIIGHIV